MIAIYLFFGFVLGFGISTFNGVWKLYAKRLEKTNTKLKEEVKDSKKLSLEYFRKMDEYKGLYDNEHRVTIHWKEKVKYVNYYFNIVKAVLETQPNKTFVIPNRILCNLDFTDMEIEESRDRKNDVVVFTLKQRKAKHE